MEDRLDGKVFAPSGICFLKGGAISRPRRDAPRTRKRAKSGLRVGMIDPNGGAAGCARGAVGLVEFDFGAYQRGKHFAKGGVEKKVGFACTDAMGRKVERIKDAKSFREGEGYAFEGCADEMRGLMTVKIKADPASTGIGISEHPLSAVAKRIDAEAVGTDLRLVSQRIELRIG